MVEAGLSRSEEYCFFEELEVAHWGAVGLAGRTRDYHILVVGAKRVKVDHYRSLKDQQGNMDAEYLNVSAEEAAVAREAFQ